MSAHYTLARQATFTVIDFETTGTVANYPVEPWQVGMVRVVDGRVAPKPHFESLLQIGERPFSPHAPGRHALLRHELACAPTPATCWSTLQQMLANTTPVAHNTATERHILARIAPLHNFGPWVDTLKLARFAFPTLPSHKLEDLITALQLQERLATLCPHRTAHDALYDAFAAALVLEHLLSQPTWHHITLEALINP